MNSRASSWSKKEEKETNIYIYLQTRCSRGCPTNTFVIRWLSDLIILFLPIFKTSLLSRRETEILRECSPTTTYHMSRVICHMSHVIGHMSCVLCHMSHVMSNFVLNFCLKKFVYKVLELISGGSVINRAYPSSFCFQ